MVYKLRQMEGNKKAGPPAAAVQSHSHTDNSKPATAWVLRLSPGYGHVWDVTGNTISFLKIKRSRTSVGSLWRNLKNI